MIAHQSDYRLHHTAASTIPPISADLLAGAALAAIIPFQKPGDETSGVFKAVQIALLALIVVSFYAVAHKLQRGRSFRFATSAAASV